MYVGSAESEKYDQVLDEVSVGPVSVGINKFLFEVLRALLIHFRGSQMLVLLCLLGLYSSIFFVHVLPLLYKCIDTRPS